MKRDLIPHKFSNAIGASVILLNIRFDVPNVLVAVNVVVYNVFKFRFDKFTNTYWLLEDTEKYCGLPRDVIPLQETVTE